jgi:tRNA(Ser,Leu) C12 N-acetylase TAN1
MMAKLIVTALGLFEENSAKRALKNILPDVRVKSTGFRGVLLAEVNGDAVQLAEQLSRKKASDIGRIVPVIREVESEFESIKENAIKIALEHIAKNESFCFRIHKRGRHNIKMPTPQIEERIGREIHLALEEKFGRKTEVDLEKPDIIILAEVLGKRTMVGIIKNDWFN